MHCNSLLMMRQSDKKLGRWSVRMDKIELPSLWKYFVKPNVWDHFRHNLYHPSYLWVKYLLVKIWSKFVWFYGEVCKCLSFKRKKKLCPGFLPFMTAIWNPTTQTTPYWCCHWLSHPGLAKFAFGLEWVVVARTVYVGKTHVHVLLLILSMRKLWAKGFPFHLVLFVLDKTLNSLLMLQSDDDTYNLQLDFCFEKPPWNDELNSLALRLKSMHWREKWTKKLWYFNFHIPFRSALFFFA